MVLKERRKTELKRWYYETAKGGRGERELSI